MGKLFGTDGIRGVVNAGLDAELAFQVGLAAAYVMAQEKEGGQPRFACDGTGEGRGAAPFCHW